jgi:hypothetical protein
MIAARSHSRADYQPSDEAIFAGYRLALADIIGHCRYAAKSLNRAASDFQNLDEDMALIEFQRAVVLVTAAAELIHTTGEGGPS